MWIDSSDLVHFGDHCDRRSDYPAVADRSGGLDYCGHSSPIQMGFHAGIFMTNYIDPDQYELANTLEETLEQHPTLSRTKDLLSQIATTMSFISGLKANIEEIYPYHCTDFSNSLNELGEWALKVQHIRTEVIKKVTDHYVKQRLL